MKKPLFALAALTLLSLTAPSSKAEAQTFTIRGSADIQPIVMFSNGNVLSLDTNGSLGIHIAPGLRLASILTLEVDLVPRIPLGSAMKFDFNVIPGVFLDLWILYVRGGVPIGFLLGDKVNVAIDGGVGLSFLGHGHVGLTLNYNFTFETFQLLGVEVGYRFDFGG